jgi:hypothetical protein
MKAVWAVSKNTYSTQRFAQPVADIVQCGLPLPQASEGTRLMSPVDNHASQLFDSMDFTGLARRTGRFPQLAH